MRCYLNCEVTVDDPWRWCPECAAALYGGEPVDFTVPDVVLLDVDTGAQVELETAADLGRLLNVAEGVW
jgi:hypothetical protein